MRSILSIVFVSGLLVGCGGSNEPAKQPSEATTTQTTGNTATNPSAPSEPASMPATTPSGDGSQAAPVATTATPTTTQTTTLSDAEIVAITSAANNGEIEQAKAALKGTQNAQVKSFANLMIKEHGEAEAKGKKLAKAANITPAENEISKRLKSESESTLATLRGQKGAELDRAYMDAQVKAHREVLSTIDDKLLPSVKDGDLKAHLGEVRHHVSMHLTKAEEISANLTGKASTSTKR